MEAAAAAAVAVVVATAGEKKATEAATCRNGMQDSICLAWLATWPFGR